MTLTLHDVAERSGATVRQLDAWDRNGLLPAHRHPSKHGRAKGSGITRFYGDHDVLVAATLVELAEAGVQGEALANAADQLRFLEVWVGRLVVAKDGDCRITGHIDAALAFSPAKTHVVTDLGRIGREARG